MHIGRTPKLQSNDSIYFNYNIYKASVKYVDLITINTVNFFELHEVNYSANMKNYLFRVIITQILKELI